MKSLIFIICLSLIISSPLTALLAKKKNNTLIRRIKKIKECIKEKGSESFNRLISRHKNETLGKIIKHHKLNITSSDLKVFNNCRKKVYLYFKKRLPKALRP